MMTNYWEQHWIDLDNIEYAIANDDFHDQKFTRIENLYKEIEDSILLPAWVHLLFAYLLSYLFIYIHLFIYLFLHLQFFCAASQNVRLIFDVYAVEKQDFYKVIKIIIHVLQCPSDQ